MTRAPGSCFERWSLQASLSSVITQAPCPFWSTPEWPAPSHHPILPSLRYPIPKPGPQTALPRKSSCPAVHPPYPGCLQLLLAQGRTACSLWGHLASPEGNYQRLLQSQRGEAVGTEKGWYRVGFGGMRPLEPGVTPGRGGGSLWVRGGGGGSWEGPACAKA